MADFEVVGTHFKVRVNDGHFSEEYEIDAPDAQSAKLIAAGMWGKRDGSRGAATMDTALRAAHDEGSGDIPAGNAMARKSESDPWNPVRWDGVQAFDLDGKLIDGPIERRDMTTAETEEYRHQRASVRANVRAKEEAPRLAAEEQRRQAAEQQRQAQGQRDAAEAQAAADRAASPPVGP